MDVDATLWCTAAVAPSLRRQGAAAEVTVQGSEASSASSSASSSPLAFPLSCPFFRLLLLLLLLALIHLQNKKLSVEP